MENQKSPEEPKRVLVPDKNSLRFKLGKLRSNFANALNGRPGPAPSQHPGERNIGIKTGRLPEEPI